MIAQEVKMESNNFSRVNPQLFSLWVGMASIVMLFGAMTSAYIVKKGAGNWLEFSVPSVFYISTAVIVLSSVTMHAARNAFRRSQEGAYKFLILATFILGLAFLVLQYQGWSQLYGNGVDLKTNVAGSFFYLITWFHAAHILGGIGALLASVINAYSLKFKVTDHRKNRVEMLTHYWHFVDVLWVYLLIFLIYIK